MKIDGVCLCAFLLNRRISNRMMSFSFFFVSLILLVHYTAHGFDSVYPNQPQLITSPQFCFNDFECPRDKYCTTFGFSSFHDGDPDEQPPTACVPRLPKGATCHWSTPCEEGTFCRRTYGVDWHIHDECAPQIPAGAPCPLSSANQCRGDLVCRVEPICRPFKFGFEGDSCNNPEDCRLLEGFYCDKMLKKCVARKRPGEECRRWVDEDGRCQGFCADHIASHKIDASVCHRLQSEGEPCTEDFQCQNIPYSLRTSRTNDFICNMPHDGTGVCVLQSDIIKELGLPCDPRMDTCDGRRGLSCALVENQYVCVQNGMSSHPFCTPGSPLSECPPDRMGNLRECRRLLNTSKAFIGLYMCRRRRQVAMLGQACSRHEFVVCEFGTSCEVVPRVDSPIAKYFIPLFRTCMRYVPIGSSCKDPFRTVCQKGSSCVEGICQESGTASQFDIELTDQWGNCSKLWCPPGTRCVVDRLFASCELPVKRVGLWESCSDSPQFRVVS